MNKMIECEIVGLNELKTKLRKLPQVVADATVNGQETAIEQAEAYAVQELQSSIKYSTGELARSFKHEVKVDGDEIVGRWWNSSMIAIFREFGTGKVGEQSRKQLPPNVQLFIAKLPGIFQLRKLKLTLQKSMEFQRLRLKTSIFIEPTDNQQDNL